MLLRVWSKYEFFDSNRLILQAHAERDALSKELESVRAELGDMEDRWKQARATITSHVMSREACLTEQK